ncbi:hypothetical protein JVU11DRAFT_59 [Chiua virens]|nr:hypothetical protein JVU11DRAFT_59 [Chiua virens]
MISTDQLWCTKKPYALSHRAILIHLLISSVSAAALFTRFEQGSDPSDLKKLIEVIIKAEGLVSIGHVDRPACLHASGVALLRHFEMHTNIADLADIDRSITLMDEAVQLISAEHASKMPYLYYLGFALLKRFGLRKDPIDLQRSVEIIEQMHKLSHQPDRSDGVNYLDILRKELLRCSERDTTDPSTIKHIITMLRAPLDSASLMSLLGEWAQITLASGSWKDALVVADNFMVPRYTIYRVTCEHLEMIDRITDAGECFCQMMIEMATKINAHDSDEADWVLNFKNRCTVKLEDLGDIALSAERHEEAVFHYSTALSLNQTSPQLEGLLIKRIKAFMARNLWDDALNDASELIKLDPSSPLGYEMKYTSLRRAVLYEEAIDAFETMLSVMSQSSDLEIRERSYQYVNPKTTRAAIRKVIEEAICESPRVLINTATGRLCDQSQQTVAFESELIFPELIFSKSTHIDYVRIKREVMEYYRYAVLSHTWENNEPTFRQVIDTSVYDLEEFPTHHKLQMFCKVAKKAGFHWAWSDVCCINKANHAVLHESLVAMFGCVVIYQGAFGTTRAWTLQEYHASKVVCFYNEDWTTYLNLDIPNHKESPEVLSEMEEAIGISAQTLLTLQPGLENIREKLRLASLRRTTRVEDAAYSLFGIFSVSLPTAYGEANRAFGRLLAQLLSKSEDASILAWTGRSGDFNSCLPAEITVFHQLPTSHIPPSMNSFEMDAMTTRLQASSLQSPLIMKMYDDLLALPAPSFTGHRLKLPCISFPLGSLSAFQKGSERVFRAQPAVLGTVEIQTKDDISRLDSLVLVHPWINFLLDRRVADVLEITKDEEVRALQVLTRLRQPFGALLLEPIPQRVAIYRRVASESMIKVQVEEITSTVLKDLIYRVRMLEVE